MADESEFFGRSLQLGDELLIAAMASPPRLRVSRLVATYDPVLHGSADSVWRVQMTLSDGSAAEGSGATQEQATLQAFGFLGTMANVRVGP